MVRGGPGGLLAAIERLRGEAEVELHFRPFELNPDMPKGGQNTIERLMAKYGYDRERIQANRKVISERAAAVGMPMRMADDNRSYNTFDAHRLLHWAGLQDPALQVALKKRLLAVYHDDNLDTSDAEVLARAAADAGLDEAQAREVLASGRYADAVRTEEAQWRDRGITSVPSVILNGSTWCPAASRRTCSNRRCARWRRKARSPTRGLPSRSVTYRDAA